MSYGSVVLSYGDSLIRDSEITILEANLWLNDAIISFYFEYLSEQAKNKQSTLFYGPTVTQLLKLIDNPDELPAILGENATTAQYAFWPVNDSSETDMANSGSHWSLLVFSRPDNNFVHFDSYERTNEKAAITLAKRLTPYFSPSANFQDFKDCCAQANLRDCGLHVLLNAEIILKYVESAPVGYNFPLLHRGLRTAAPHNVDKMRPELLKLIRELATEKH